MSDETKIFTKNDKNGDKCASGGQESGLKLIFERGVAILVRPWRFPGQPKKFVFFSIKVGTINSGTSLDSREQFKKTGKLEMTREQFKKTGKLEMKKIAAGIFWYWNADPSPGGIRRQLEQIKTAGFECVYLHPMPDSFHKPNFFQGMKIPYLGEKYFALAGVMLEECRRLKLSMMLYDEGGWPSGGVLDTLIRKHPECRAVYLARTENGYERRICDIPDLLNSHTTECFIRMTHERYRGKFGTEFGRTIRGIFTDEPFWSCQPGGDLVRIADGLGELVGLSGCVFPSSGKELFGGSGCLVCTEPSGAGRAFQRRGSVFPNRSKRRLSAYAGRV